MCWFVSHQRDALVACRRMYDCCVPYELCIHGTNSNRWGQQGHIILWLWRSAVWLGIRWLVCWLAERLLQPRVLPAKPARYWFPLISCLWQWGRRLWCGSPFPWAQYCQMTLPYMWFHGRDGHYWILLHPIRTVVWVSRDTQQKSDVWNLSMFFRIRISVAIPCMPLVTCRLH